MKSLKIPYYESLSPACTIPTIRKFIERDGKKFKQKINDKIFLLDQIIYILYTSSGADFMNGRIASVNNIACDITSDELAILLDKLFIELGIA